MICLSEGKWLSEFEKNVTVFRDAFYKLVRLSVAPELGPLGPLRPHLLKVVT